MRIVFVVIVALVAVVSFASVARADWDSFDGGPCDSARPYIGTARYEISEMDAYVQQNQIDNANAMFQGALHDLLTSSNILQGCGDRETIGPDWTWTMAQLIEHAQSGGIMSSADALTSMTNLLKVAYNHGASKEQVRQWTEEAKRYAAMAGVTWQDPNG